MLGERISSVPGSSDYFVGGFITYSDAMKCALLGVDPTVLERFGAVSKQAAEAMAEGALRLTGSTYALSVTGAAGPDPAPLPGGATAAVGTVYVGLAEAEGAQVTHRVFLGDRQRIRGFTTQMALDLLRRHILGIK